ncbi:MAG: NAD(P)H-hydrate dehydratase [Geminicoccaceae bacterium]|nr:NAD(P)H-hydrate dehydratase [Geminicoccaceae bacterium]
MAAVDRAAIAAGVPGSLLMENAGRAVVRALIRRFPPQPVLVLCGPGNNGGDGYVVARRLRRAGWPVRVAAIRPEGGLKGDAASAAAGWPGEALPLEAALEAGEGLVVDALFGAGLGRDLDGAARAALEAAGGRGASVVAVDVPSGVDGATGAVRGFAPEAALTVTFARLKPGHLLLPGSLRCGGIELADIGIPDAVLAVHDTGWRVNRPALWRHLLPVPAPGGNKYDRGHAVVVGGPMRVTGASAMAADAALRAGAGLVSVAVPPGALPVYAAQLRAVMTKPVASVEALADLAGDRRVKALLIGPGAGVGEATRARVLALLATGTPCVLDADALTSFAGDPAPLFERLHAGCVLTPHDGEYARLFDAEGSRLGRAIKGAARSGAVLLLKGSDTCVAAPDGRATINEGAPSFLATAGAGDVLAGIVLGLLAQGMPAFDAASAAVWLHARAATAVGPGLVASSIEDGLPAAFAKAMAPDDP